MVPRQMSLYLWAARTACPALFVFLLAPPASARALEAFPLVAQAVSAKHALSFVARQRIFMAPAPDKSGKSTGKAIHIEANVLQSGREMRMTYLLPATAARRVVVDDGKMLRQWEPAQRVILEAPSRVESLAERRRMLALLHRNYRCLLLRHAHANGLSCDIVSVRPRPGHIGPTRLLWIEQAHHAILRTEEFDIAGIRRYLSSYQTFHYISPVPVQRFALPKGMRVCSVETSGQAASTFREAFAQAGIEGRLPAWLPSGYVLISSEVTAGPAGKRATLLRYSDGLKMLSVFEARKTGSGADARSSAPPAGMQIWQQTYGALHVAVVGDNTMPAAIGQGMLTALGPQSAERLRKGLAAGFGRGARLLAARLRRQGWGYDQIAAVCLCLKARREHLYSAWQKRLPIPTARMEHQAHLWVASIVDHD